MSNFIEGEDYSVFHPGYYLEALIKETGVSEEILSRKTSIPLTEVHQLINGDMTVTPEVARKLSTLEISENVWLNLQSQYNKQMKLNH